MALGSNKPVVPEQKPSAGNKNNLGKSRKLFVGNMSFKTTAVSLCDFFLNYGEVESAKPIYDRETNRPRGYGFVIMHDQKGVQRALRDKNPIIDGRRVKIQVAIEDPSRWSTSQNQRPLQFPTQRRSSPSSSPPSSQSTPAPPTYNELYHQDFPGLPPPTVPGPAASYVGRNQAVLPQHQPQAGDFRLASCSTLSPMAYEPQNNFTNGLPQATEVPRPGQNTAIVFGQSFGQLPGQNSGNFSGTSSTQYNHGTLPTPLVFNGSQLLVPPPMTRTYSQAVASNLTSVQLSRLATTTGNWPPSQLNNRSVILHGNNLAAASSGHKQLTYQDTFGLPNHCAYSGHNMAFGGGQNQPTFVDPNHNQGAFGEQHQPAFVGHDQGTFGGRCLETYGGYNQAICVGQRQGAFGDQNQGMYAGQCNRTFGVQNQGTYAGQSQATYELHSQSTYPGQRLEVSGGHNQGIFCEQHQAPYAGQNYAVQTPSVYAGHMQGQQGPFSGQIPVVDFDPYIYNIAVQIVNQRYLHRLLPGPGPSSSHFGFLANH